MLYRSPFNRPSLTGLSTVVCIGLHAPPVTDTDLQLGGQRGWGVDYLTLGLCSLRETKYLRASVLCVCVCAGEEGGGLPYRSATDHIRTTPTNNLGSFD